VLSRLNDVFQMEKQYNKFFTIWYGVYSIPSRALAYSSGGHPPALLVGPDGAIGQLQADNPVIGMLPPGIDFDMQTIAVAAGSRLLVYSDGVYEIEQPDGRMWTLDELIATIARLQGEGAPCLDGLRAHVEQLHGSGVLADDYSMLEVHF
jgi:sigma-B regulation protein RsbU (phosphoserine phosphatase)